MIYDPFNKLMKDVFGLPIVYQLPVTRTKGEVFTKSNIQQQEDGSFRASVSRFVDGNSDSTTVVVKTLEEAKQFVKENK